MTPAVELLESRSVPHRVVAYDHLPGAAYGPEAAAALDVDPGRVLKTLVAQTSDGELVVAVLPVAARLDLKALARSAGAKRATMAEPEVAERSTGYVRGGISPLGQRRELRTFVDRSAFDFDEVLVSGGRRGLEIALAPADLVATVAAAVADLSD